MANGLTLRVPKGWSGTLTRETGPTPAIRGALGALGASELLVLQQRGSTLRIRISSSADEQVAALPAAGYRPVVASAEATVFEVPAGSATKAPALAVISTHALGARFGLMLFEHTAGSASETVEAVWRLLKVKGVAAPLRPIAGP